MYNGHLERLILLALLRGRRVRHLLGFLLATGDLRMLHLIEVTNGLEDDDDLIDLRNTRLDLRNCRRIVRADESTLTRENGTLVVVYCR